MNGNEDTFNSYQVKCVYSKLICTYIMCEIINKISHVVQRHCAIDELI